MKTNYTWANAFHISARLLLYTGIIVSALVLYKQENTPTDKSTVHPYSFTQTDAR